MIIIGADHGGFLLKEFIKSYLYNKGYDFDDIGTYSLNSVDYPDFAHIVASNISCNKNNIGILVCGTGNGVNIVANKYKNVRSALCWNEIISKYAKEHNNANIICLPGRFLTLIEAEKILDSYFNAQFESGRHQKRINLIENE